VPFIPLSHSLLSIMAAANLASDLNDIVGMAGNVATAAKHIYDLMPALSTMKKPANMFVRKGAKKPKIRIGPDLQGRAAAAATEQKIEQKLQRLGVPRIARNRFARTTYSIRPTGQRQRFKIKPPSGRKVRQGLINVAGREWIGTIFGGTTGGSIAPPMLAGSGSNKGTLLYTAAINPIFGPKRLAAQAQFYEKYRFRYLRFRLKGTSGTTIAGSCAGAFDQDCADSIGTGNDAYLAITSQPSGSNAKYYDSTHTWVMPPVFNGTSDGGLYTNSTATSDPRLVSSATFNLVAEMPTKNEAGGSDPTNATEVAELWAEYSCDLWAPTTESFAFNTVGWSNYLTSTGLTKANSNGNTPFTANNTNVFGTDLVIDPLLGTSGTVPSFSNTTSTQDTLSFPASWPAAQITFALAASSGTMPTITTSAGLNAVALPSSTASAIFGGAAATATQIMNSKIYYQVTPGAAWNIKIAGAAASSPVFTTVQAIATPMAVSQNLLKALRNRSQSTRESEISELLDRYRRSSSALSLLPPYYDKRDGEVIMLCSRCDRERHECICPPLFQREESKTPVGPTPTRSSRK
jgi:hypothetical protein